MFFAMPLLVFLVFPFTQIIPLDTYNQPYALVWAAIVFLLNPQILTAMRADVRNILIYLASIGTFFLGLQLISDPRLRDLIYWLSYISPVVITPAALWAIREHGDLTKKILSVGIVAWLLVSAIQLFYDNGFLTFLVSEQEELGFNVVQSGRGVLGFAPEPTHHGLHLLVLGASLLAIGGKRIYVYLALFGILFFSRSTTAVLAMTLGLLIWAAFQPIQRGWVFLGALVVLAIGASLTMIESDIRVIRLLANVLEDGPAALLTDASANARINGVIFPIINAFQNGLIPLGLSHEAWLDTVYEIVRRNRSIFALSETGPASGYGLILVQTGWFAIPVIYILGKVMVWEQRHTYTGILCIAGFLAFMGQLYLATPSFSLMLAACIYVTEKARADNRTMFQSAMQPPKPRESFDPV